VVVRFSGGGHWSGFEYVVQENSDVGGARGCNDVGSNRRRLVGGCRVARLVMALQRRR
jgi:hypothetical protein